MADIVVFLVASIVLLGSSFLALFTAMAIRHDARLEAIERQARLNQRCFEAQCWDHESRMKIVESTTAANTQHIVAAGNAIADLRFEIRPTIPADSP